MNPPGSVCCDAGPLIALAKIDRLDLLALLYGRVVIPPAVHRELTHKPTAETARIESALLGHIVVTQLPAGELEELPSRGLGEGEREVILLARHLGGRVLMDDRAGRAAAQAIGLKTFGVVGLLLLAKQVGLVPALLPILERIRGTGYWISDAVVSEARGLAGE